ncbi:glycosyl hydrolase [Heyndrickxia ginsengihumi]|uniref:glycosyl hydrolase n=1 Tax=Heyndrickxia ginsengihumi TaxID=363870 RepID=UPI003D257714
MNIKIRTKTGITLLMLVMSITSLVSNTSPKKTNDTIIYQAENSLMNGVLVRKKGSGFSGKGYVTDFNNRNDFAEFHINAPSSGYYELKVGYRVLRGQGNKRTNIVLNGKKEGEISLVESNNFTESRGIVVKLREGMNNLKFMSDWGYYDLDYIKIKFSSKHDISNIKNKLANTHATKEAQELMNFLVETYGKKIISGQQQISYVESIHSVTGKRPAIVGFDLKDYSPSLAQHGISSKEVLQAIKWHREGGIVEIQWHWNAPKDLKDWSHGYYSNQTSFDIKYALSNHQSTDYKLLIRDIDAIAVQLETLQKANVPILFRPLHEAEGGWFWWGAKGPEPAKELYRLLFNRLTYHFKINNLIWIWNSSSPEWYPGDKYVDIVSYDSYPSPMSYNSVQNEYKKLAKLVRNKKIVTMSENGSIPEPNNIFYDKAYWSWFLTWENCISTDNSLDHVRKVYNDPNVITLSDLKNYF